MHMLASRNILLWNNLRCFDRDALRVARTQFTAVQSRAKFRIAYGTSQGSTLSRRTTYASLVDTKRNTGRTPQEDLTKIEAGCSDSVDVAQFLKSLSFCSLIINLRQSRQAFTGHGLPGANIIEILFQSNPSGDDGRNEPFGTFNGGATEQEAIYLSTTQRYLCDSVRPCALHPDLHGVGHIRIPSFWWL